MKKTITIEMRGGLPESVILPVELKDYEVRIIEFEFGDPGDLDEDDIKTDENGREYYEYQADYKEVENDSENIIGDSTAMDMILKVMNHDKCSPVPPTVAIDSINEILRMAGRKI